MCIQYTQIQIFHPLSKNKDPTQVYALEIRRQTTHHHWNKNCQPQPEMSMKSPNLHSA